MKKNHHFRLPSKKKPKMKKNNKLELRNQLVSMQFILQSMMRFINRDTDQLKTLLEQIYERYQKAKSFIYTKEELAEQAKDEEVRKKLLDHLENNKNPQVLVVNNPIAEEQSAGRDGDSRDDSISMNSGRLSETVTRQRSTGGFIDFNPRASDSILLYQTSRGSAGRRSSLAEISDSHMLSQDGREKQIHNFEKMKAELQQMFEKQMESQKTAQKNLQDRFDILMGERNESLMKEFSSKFEAFEGSLAFDHSPVAVSNLGRKQTAPLLPLNRHRTLQRVSVETLGTMPREWGMEDQQQIPTRVFYSPRPTQNVPGMEMIPGSQQRISQPLKSRQGENIRINEFATEAQADQQGAQDNRLGFKEPTPKFLANPNEEFAKNLKRKGVVVTSHSVTPKQDIQIEIPPGSNHIKIETGAPPGIDKVIEATPIVNTEATEQEAHPEVEKVDLKIEPVREPTEPSIHQKRMAEQLESIQKMLAMMQKVPKIEKAEEEEIELARKISEKEAIQETKIIKPAPSETKETSTMPLFVHQQTQINLYEFTSSKGHITEFSQTEYIKSQSSQTEPKTIANNSEQETQTDIPVTQETQTDSTSFKTMHHADSQTAKALSVEIQTEENFGRVLKDFEIQVREPQEAAETQTDLGINSYVSVQAQTLKLMKQTQELGVQAGKELEGKEVQTDVPEPVERFDQEIQTEGNPEQFAQTDEIDTLALPIPIGGDIDQSFMSNFSNIPPIEEAPEAQDDQIGENNVVSNDQMKKRKMATKKAIKARLAKRRGSTRSNMPLSARVRAKKPTIKKEKIFKKTSQYGPQNVNKRRKGAKKNNNSMNNTFNNSFSDILEDPDSHSSSILLAEPKLKTTPSKRRGSLKPVVRGLANFNTFTPSKVEDPILKTISTAEKMAASEVINNNQLRPGDSKHNRSAVQFQQQLDRSMQDDDLDISDLKELLRKNDASDDRIATSTTKMSKELYKAIKVSTKILKTNSAKQFEKMNLNQKFILENVASVFSFLQKIPDQLALMTFQKNFEQEIDKNRFETGRHTASLQESVVFWLPYIEKALLNTIDLCTTYKKVKELKPNEVTIFGQEDEHNMLAAQLNGHYVLRHNGQVLEEGTYSGKKIEKLSPKNEAILNSIFFL